MKTLKKAAIGALRKSERFTGTDMVYLASAGLWTNAQTVTTALGSFVLYVMFAHFLPKETYGLYQYLLSLFAIVTTVTLTGMNTAVTRAVAQNHDGILKHSIRIQLVYGIIPTLLGGCIALYYVIAGNYTIAIGAAIVAVLAPLLYTFNTYNAFLTGKKDFKRNGIFGLTGSFLYYGFLVLAVVLGADVLVLLFINLAVQVVTHVFFYFVTLRIYKPTEPTDPAAVRYSFHLSAMNFISALASQLDNVFAFHFLGPVALATYSFATAVPDRLGSISYRFLGNAALPRFSTRSALEIRSKLLPKVLYGMSITVIVVAIYTILAHWFFSVFFATYMEAVPLSILYAATVIFNSGTVLPLTALTATKKTQAMYVGNLLISGCQVAFPLLGVLTFGIWGLVAGKVISSCLAFIIVITISKVSLK
ncbi:MAG: oligosaccharide flippase family protein [Candidatus Pacebacteria bacterium]|nr:oligosaccharide flippase family protein [Candidatus Paceibacterota bacterium]